LTALAVADVNGDGRPDLVTANDGNNTVSVLLGNQNAATQFQVSAPSSATAGTPFTITVTALTAGNQLDALYAGTVHFKSSDKLAVLPANYTFTLADAGSHTFSVTLNTTGNQTITATDKKTSSIHGSAVVNVTSGAAPSPPAARGSRQGGSAMDPATAAAAGRFFSDPDGTASLLGLYTFPGSEMPTRPPTPILTTAGNWSATATDTATLSYGTAVAPANLVRWAGGRSLDSNDDRLNPAGVETFFAQDALKRHSGLGEEP
jgi:hypothetical protein